MLDFAEPIALERPSAGWITRKPSEKRTTIIAARAMSFVFM
jgi:hypothetical protein